jgi:protein CpxP
MVQKILGTIIFGSFILFSQMIFADDSIYRETLHKIVQSLNLTDAQKTQINPILSELKSELKKVGSQMGNIRSEIKQQVNSTNMDKTKVNDLVDKKTKLIGDMIKAKLTAQNKIYSILNPEQRQKLSEAINKADEKMEALFKSCEKE